MSSFHKQKTVAKHGTQCGNFVMLLAKTFSCKLGLIYPEILIYTEILVHYLLAFHNKKILGIPQKIEKGKKLTLEIFYSLVFFKRCRTLRVVKHF